MAYSFGISPATPAIPTIHAELTKNVPKDTTPLGPIACRLATLDDMPELARLANKIFQYYPVDLIRYQGTRQEDHLKMCENAISRSILREDQRVYVAVATTTNKIQGYLRWSRVGMGDPDNEKALPVKFTVPGEDQQLHERYQENVNIWADSLLRVYGPHFVGDVLGVEPIIRNRGVAASLCLLLAREAEESGYPVFLITVYNSVPFYERFCLLHGYALKMCCTPVFLDKQKTLCHYLFQIVKAAPDLRDKAPVERKWRTPSPS